MTIHVGDRAPGFALVAKPGDVVDVGTMIGKEPIVLLFFPLAFSSVCTAEMCHFRDNWAEWTRLGAKVFGISIDSPFVTDRFRQEEKIPFPLLSDFNKNVAQSYGVLMDDLKGMKGVSKRTVFIIGRDGTIAYAAVNDDPSKQIDFEAAKAAVAKLK